jgi:hypothetical protein
MNIPTNCLQNIVFKSTIAKYFDGKWNFWGYNDKCKTHTQSMWTHGK